MKFILKALVFFYTLKGGMSYRYDKFHIAIKYLEKAIKYNSDNNHVLLFQYYGHSLFRINEIDNSFIYLKRSYEIYEDQKWFVSNDEEHRLASETLKVLQYLITNYGKTINGFQGDKEINKRGSS